MKVLDIHIHVGRREHLTPSLISFLEEEMGPATVELAQQLTPDALVDLLDAHGVRLGVILAEYSPRTTGVIPNEFVSEFCRQTDRIIPFASIDLESDAPPADQTEKAVKQLGCKGIKLLPSYTRLYPDDPRLLPAYEVAQGLGIPIMFHTGTSVFPGSRIRYANPLLLDDIAEDFPRLNLVMCHGGRPFWYKEAEWMLRRHKNMHIDISGIPLRKLPELFPKVEAFRDRYIFGSDWPTRPNIADYVGEVTRFPYTAETIQAILWDNGARLLGLES
ncbi:MAG: amidohydrolase [Deltaproteobacteria bacterium]|nr:amidohydrolase [Deltaproteobacteria bacterium]